MRCTVGPLIAVFLLGLVLPIAIFTTYTGSKSSGAGGRSSFMLKSFQSESLSPWQRHIKQQCRRHSQPTSLDSIKPELFKHFLVDDKYKLIYCQIPKVATTTWRRIFIIITGKVGTTDLMALAPNDVHHKHDEHLTYLSDLTEDEIRYKLRTYFKFIFVREPFERLLSAFRNKFDTPYKYKSLSYFQNAFGRKIIKRYRPNHSATQENNDRVTFAEFIDYLVDPEPHILTNEHWEQFYKLCLPCAIDYDFIGKLESIQDDSEFLLQKSGLNGVIKFPSRQESRYKSKKTNTLLKEYYSKISKNKLKELWNTYKEDFDIFNYTIPDDVKVLMNE